ncbi:MAG: VOC family protein [Taibaiella sp.]|jgi:catechol 2,3-dioxygenase-like lactoylglutathione lyase family enzyme
MKLNHLSVAVPDVAAATAFMEKFFGFETENIKGNNVIAVLRGKDNFVLVLTTLRQGESAYPSDFHFGFILDTEAEVLLKYEQLIAEGIEVPRAPAKIRNSYAFYFHMPGGIMMEVSCSL